MTGQLAGASCGRVGLTVKHIVIGYSGSATGGNQHEAQHMLAAAGGSEKVGVKRLSVYYDADQALSLPLKVYVHPPSIYQCSMMILMIGLHR